MTLSVAPQRAVEGPCCLRKRKAALFELPIIFYNRMNAQIQKKQGMPEQKVFEMLLQKIDEII